MRLNFPFPIHRHFIRLFWICFPLNEKTFSKYSYLPLLVIITITTILFNNIINKRFSQKMFYQTVTWRCQFETLLVENVCSGISMAYYGYNVFWDKKNRRISWDVRSWDETPGKCFMFRKSFEQAKSSLK